MDFILETMSAKIEFFEAYDLRTLEKRIDEQIQMNKALMLDVHSVSHHVVFDPDRSKMLYSAVVHFKKA
ncbi:DUF2536 family protein [Paenibacillus sp. GCM10012307]|uniref:DUF2536 family protein n=1 Tax=Paenibacillus roseus TaxID=2798579 RepID=A0A934MQ67_9BACL|nr:DUF2536 family protein [Paenibacillus roseus]MBJ6362831.1 DUF2536 family protein [Paenibacillus roseus]